MKIKDILCHELIDNWECFDKALNSGDEDTDAFITLFRSTWSYLAERARKDNFTTEDIRLINLLHGVSDLTCRIYMEPYCDGEIPVEMIVMTSMLVLLLDSIPEDQFRSGMIERKLSGATRFFTPDGTKLMYDEFYEYHNEKELYNADT